MSSLFLDTDISLDRSWLAYLLAAPPYSLEELEQILTAEVYPVCRWNLYSVAGEWTGFDLAWLEAEVLRRARSSRSPFQRWYRFSSGARTLRRSAEWQATLAAVTTIRG